MNSQTCEDSVPVLLFPDFQLWYETFRFAVKAVDFNVGRFQCESGALRISERAVRWAVKSRRIVSACGITRGEAQDGNYSTRYTAQSFNFLLLSLSCLLNLCFLTTMVWYRTRDYKTNEEGQRKLPCSDKITQRSSVFLRIAVPYLRHRCTFRRKLIPLVRSDSMRNGRITVVG